MRSPTVAAGTNTSSGSSSAFGNVHTAIIAAAVITVPINHNVGFFIFCSCLFFIMIFMGGGKNYIDTILYTKGNKICPISDSINLYQKERNIHEAR